MYPDDVARIPDEELVRPDEEPSRADDTESDEMFSGEADEDGDREGLF